ncbi:hypothetical protein KSP39_PZI002856 [Platanthera zijinensis]|uniref:Uncharacterized protein n=1 Tax=Platanthera zijinensis TaxID=2320716 RepID=A0AAP0BX34_9ASPA
MAKERGISALRTPWRKRISYTRREDGSPGARSPIVHVGSSPSEGLEAANPISQKKKKERGNIIYRFHSMWRSIARTQISVIA